VRSEPVETSGQCLQRALPISDLRLETTGERRVGFASRSGIIAGKGV